MFGHGYQAVCYSDAYSCRPRYKAELTFTEKLDRTEALQNSKCDTRNFSIHSPGCLYVRSSGDLHLITIPSAFQALRHSAPPLAPNTFFNSSAAVLTSPLLLELVLNSLRFLTPGRQQRSHQAHSCQPDISPNTDSHARVIMAVQFIMLPSTESGCHMVEDCHQNSSALEGEGGLGRVDAKNHKQKGEGD